MVGPGHKLGNSQVKVYRTIGPTLVLLFHSVSYFALNIDCGFSLDPPQTFYAWSENTKNIKFLQLKISNFTAVKIAAYCMGVLT